MGGDSFSNSEHQVLYNIVAAQSIIAIILNCFSVYTFLRFKSLRKRSYELVFILAVCTVLANVSYLLKPRNNSPDHLCIIQGFAQNFFDLSMIVWTTWIAYCLYNAVVRQRGSPSMLMMHIVTWSICLILSVPPLITSSYIDLGPWCWISGNNLAGKIERFVCFYIPLWIAFAVNLFLYYHVSGTLRRFALLSSIGNSDSTFSGGNSSMAPNHDISGNSGGNGDGNGSEKLNNNNGNEESERLLRMANHLQWYPLIFVVSWVVNTLVRVVQAIYPPYDYLYVFALIQVIFNGIFYQSVGNVFAYGFNGPVRKEWAGLLNLVRSKGSCLPFCFCESNNIFDGGDQNDLAEVDMRPTSMRS